MFFPAPASPWKPTTKLTFAGRVAAAAAVRGERRAFLRAGILCVPQRMLLRPSTRRDPDRLVSAYARPFSPSESFTMSYVPAAQQRTMVAARPIPEAYAHSTVVARSVRYEQGWVTHLYHIVMPRDFPIALECGNLDGKHPELERKPDYSVKGLVEELSMDRVKTV